jgi:hypothetical protein
MKWANVKLWIRGLTMAPVFHKIPHNYAWLWSVSCCTTLLTGCDVPFEHPRTTFWTISCDEAGSAFPFPETDQGTPPRDTVLLQQPRGTQLVEKFPKVNDERLSRSGDGGGGGGWRFRLVACRSNKHKGNTPHVVHTVFNECRIYFILHAPQ